MDYMWHDEGLYNKWLRNHSYTHHLRGFISSKSKILWFSLCQIGDIQIGMMEKKGQLEVEVIRARGLVQKPGSKSLPGENQKTLFFFYFIFIQQPGSGYKGKKTGATKPVMLLRNVLDWDVWLRLQWLGSAAPTNGLFIVLSLPPAPYVKVYLLNNGAYVAKKKTKIARKTLDPLYQQALLFEESPQGKVLQVRTNRIP